jgi:hypothetical protein
LVVAGARGPWRFTRASWLALTPLSFSPPYSPARLCSPSLSPKITAAGRRASIFTRAHAYDLLKGAIIVAAVAALGVVQISRVYHYIRGEAVIKLYVTFNILEIGDRLLCSLGADVMDALYRTTRDHLQLPKASPGGRNAGSAGGEEDDGADDEGSGTTSSSPSTPTSPSAAALRLALHFVVAVAYCVAHSLVLFVQVVCLNVAINSRNNALLTLLISNNFVELKSSVFRRFDAENLFQVACADTVERFQLSLFLLLIGLQELSSWDTFAALLPSILAIFACEVMVDYVKHSFISKFNRLHANLYSTFKVILCHDLVSVRRRMRTSLDPTHTCVKRLGLATLPLTVVVIRMVLLKVDPTMLPRLDSLYGLAAAGLIFACLCAAKMGLGMALLAHAASVTRDAFAAVADEAAADSADGGKATGVDVGRSSPGKGVQRGPGHTGGVGGGGGGGAGLDRGVSADQDQPDLLQKLSSTTRYGMRNARVPV